MMQYHKYSLAELEEMIPFEREVYVFMLIQYLEEEKKRISEDHDAIRALLENLIDISHPYGSTFPVCARVW
mgnify:CR=1 FL=1